MKIYTHIEKNDYILYFSIDDSARNYKGELETKLMIINLGIYQKPEGCPEIYMIDRTGDTPFPGIFQEDISTILEKYKKQLGLGKHLKIN